MNQYERQSDTATRPPIEKPADDAYAPAIESLSGKWRDIQTTEPATETPSLSSKKNTTALGIGIGVALVIFLAIVGGFLLLVWTVNR